MQKLGAPSGSASVIPYDKWSGRISPWANGRRTGAAPGARAIVIAKVISRSKHQAPNSKRRALDFGVWNLAPGPSSRRAEDSAPCLILEIIYGHRSILPEEGNDFGKAVSRILSAPNLASGENHLSEQPIPGTRSLSRTAAGRCRVPYLALHPMGFSVPRRLRFARCALTPPFHPYLPCLRRTGGLFSVALSVNAPLGGIARVYLRPEERSYAASRPVVFGLSSFRLRGKRFSAFPKSFGR